MGDRIYRSCTEAIRKNPSWEERWEGQDKGLITCWEVGRKLRMKEPEFARRAENGELPLMAWKGGIEEKIKTRKKYGTLNYLAAWQGLRGEDLDIDLSQEYELICSKTGIRFIYTGDVKKYAKV